jgi:antitoxin ParD1/3/4
MDTTALRISLSDELARFVAERVASGAYRDPSDYVHALIREDRERRVQEHLEALLVDGLASGEPAPLDEAEWARLRREVEAQIAIEPGSA